MSTRRTSIPCRTRAVPALALVLGLIAIGTITILEQRSVAARDAEMELAKLEVQLNRLQSVPFEADVRRGASAAGVRAAMWREEERIRDRLGELLDEDAPAALDRVSKPIEANFELLYQVYEYGAGGQGYDGPAERIASQADGVAARVGRMLDSAGAEYNRRAHSSQTRAMIGSAAVILLLLGAFGFLYRRSVRARSAVERSGDRFRTLVENIPGAVYRRSGEASWAMLYVSDSIEDITGYPAPQLVGGAIDYGDIVDPEHSVHADAEIVATRGDDGFTVEYPLTHADGGVRWVRDKGQAIRDEDGTIVWVDGTLSDITEIKRLEQERERIETELHVAQRLEAVGQLAAGIAHEVNTPVQYVGSSVRFMERSFEDLRELLAGYRALCLEAGGDTAAVEARIAEIEEAADLARLEERLPEAFERALDGLRRVAQIVTAVRDFGGPERPGPEATDLNEALRSTLVLAQNEYRYVADVRTDFGDLPPIVCNVSEMSQVFLNLIVNAAYAIAQVIRPHSGERGTIRVRTERDGGSVLVTISDTGGGIRPEIGERIFDPFFTTKGIGRGTGQGLAIARSIVVDKHHGSIGVDSKVGEGTTFSIRLPLDAEAAGLGEARAA